MGKGNQRPRRSKQEVGRIRKNVHRPRQTLQEPSRRIDMQVERREQVVLDPPKGDRISNKHLLIRINIIFILQSYQTES